MFTYISNHLQKRLQSDLLGFSPHVQRLQAEIHQLRNPLELSPRLGLVGIGNRLYLYRGGKGTPRLLLEPRLSEGDYIVLFYDVLDHQTRTYEKFNENRAKEESRIRSFITEKEIYDYLSMQSESMKEEHRLPQLPQQRSIWIHTPGCLGYWFSENPMIYESDAWVKVFEHPSMRLHRLLVYRLVSRAYQFGRRNSLSTVRVEELEDQGIYIRFYVLPKNYGVWFGLYLDVLCDKNIFVPEEQIRNLVFQDIEEIKQISRRAYPADRLKHFEAWSVGEENVTPSLDPRLPLSREELSILDSLADRTKLPLFLDGPAGSGKSTLLSYLLAGLFHYAHNIGVGQPLFVTYSPRLRDETRQRVFLQIRFHFHNMYKSLRDEKALWHLVNSNIQTSTDAFRNILPEEFTNFFQPFRKMNFSLFQKAYRASFEGTSFSLSAEEVWFILRSFVKGYMTPNLSEAFQKSDQGLTSVYKTILSSTEVLSPEDFHNLPDDWRLGVEAGVYQDVLKKIWPWYQKWLKEKNLWDDQDLALCALAFLHRETTEPVPRWMAVVCDEAQDLTRNELRVLFRFVGSTHYNLTRNQPVFPMLFAADPQQTVNPSGFQWAGFTSSCFEETALLVGVEKTQGRAEQRLQWNYRACERLTLLAGAIQSWRRLHLDRTEARGSLAWTEEKGEVFRYTITPKSKEQLEKGLRRSIITILPCSEGEEEQYIQDDPFLSQLFVPQNEREELLVFSPVSSKGLEFERVILYGFGKLFREKWEYCYGKPRKEQESQPLKRKSNTQMPLDFALNALYVAATRARRVLYFIDLPEDDAFLWGNEGLGGIPEALNLVELQEDARTLVEVEVYQQEVVENASSLLRAGMERNDASFCRQAAKLFAEIKDELRAKNAEQWAILFSALEMQQVRADVLVLFQGTDEQKKMEKHLWEQEAWSFLSLLEQRGARFTSLFGLLGSKLSDLGKSPEKTLCAAFEIVKRLLSRLEEFPEDDVALRVYGSLIRHVVGLLSHQGQVIALFTREDWQQFYKICDYFILLDISQALEFRMWTAAAAGLIHEARSHLLELDSDPQSEAFSQKDARILYIALGLWFLKMEQFTEYYHNFSFSKEKNETEQRQKFLILILQKENVRKYIRENLMSVLGWQYDPETYRMISALVCHDVLHDASDALQQMLSVGESCFPHKFKGNYAA